MRLILSKEIINSFKFQDKDKKCGVPPPLKLIHSLLCLYQIMHLPNLTNIKESSSNKAFKRNPSENPPSYNESISQVSSPISLTPVSSASRVPTLSNSNSNSKARSSKAVY